MKTTKTIAVLLLAVGALAPAVEGGRRAALEGQVQDRRAGRAKATWRGAGRPTPRAPGRIRAC
ncbi:MAG: hypothetical protein ACOX5G_12990 [Kiritimatiellia bacterium]